MSFFVTKTLLATLFIAAGLTAALSMLTLMGKAERRMGVMALRNMHRVAGYVFATLLVVLAVMGARYLSAAGDSLSVRGVLHWSLASLLVFVLALKLAVVRWFKQFIKFVPVMGMTVITLALVVTTLSAVFFVVTGGFGGSEPRDTTSVEIQNDADDTPVAAAADEASADAGQREETSTSVDQGGQVFGKYCSGCHYDDSTGKKIGPGLAGLFARDTIEASGMPMSPENVRTQIVAPAGGMPSFEPYLSEQQLDDLIVYLETL
ncbi:MAG: cytochrome c [Candidatus Eisenbacteria bacterium]